MNRRVFAALVLAALPALAGLPAYAQGGPFNDHVQAREGVEAGDVLPVSALLDRVRSTIAGEIVDVQLEPGGTGLEYRLKYIDPAGRVVEARFDARTGQPLGQ